MEECLQDHHFKIERRKSPENAVKLERRRKVLIVKTYSFNNPDWCFVIEMLIFIFVYLNTFTDS